jgi:hypothetical protein
MISFFRGKFESWIHVSSSIKPDHQREFNQSYPELSRDKEPIIKFILYLGKKLNETNNKNIEAFHLVKWPYNQDLNLTIFNSINV